MSKYGKWIGGGLGWVLGGPIGALLGFAFGSMFDGMQSGKYEYKGQLGGFADGQQTQTGDFNVSLLILSAAVMRADGKVVKAELDYVKRFLIQQFGIDEAERQLLILREILKQQINLYEVCSQIKQYMIAIRKEMDEITEGKADKDNNVIKNAPHTARMVTADEWKYPYSRQQAAYPVASLYNNKYWCPVTKIDDAWGDRNLMCTCAPIEDYK